MTALFLASESVGADDLSRFQQARQNRRDLFALSGIPLCTLSPALP